MKVESYKDLITWQKSMELVVEIYKLTKLFPKDETYGLVSQMRRAVSSITANIAEGFGRQGYKEKVQFYYLSQGSLTELKNFMIIAKDVGYLTSSQYEKLNNQANLTHKLLQGLITKSKTFINPKS